MAEGWKRQGGLLKGPGIPAPSGIYEVGCNHLMHDGLLVRLYYPIERELSTNYDYAKFYFHPNYVKAIYEYLETKNAGLVASITKMFINPRIPARFGPPLLRQDIPKEPPQSESDNSVTTDSEAVRTDPQSNKFPVIIFSHGLGTSFFTYSGVCCDLAPHGYVVAALEHKDGSACLALRRIPGRGVEEGQYNHYICEWIPYLKSPKDNFEIKNEQVKKRCQEARQGLDLLQLLNEGSITSNMLGGKYDFTQFKGRLNTESAAIIGHSFGGATMALTLSEDSRFRCGIGLDTWMFPLGPEFYSKGIEQPCMFINSYSFQWAENVANMMKLVKPVTETGFSQCSLYTIKGTHHFNQSDSPFILPSGIMKEMSMSPLNKYTAHNINMELCQAFLRRFLLRDPIYQKSVPILDGGDTEYIIYGTNVDWEAKEDTSHDETDPANNEISGLEDPANNEIPGLEDPANNEIPGLEDPANNEIPGLEDPANNEIPGLEDPANNEIPGLKDPANNEIPGLEECAKDN